MSGVIANSSSKSMLSGDTSADNSVSGYVTGEQITLTVTDSAPTSVEWSQAIPSTSGASRSALSASTGSSVTFTPDVGGYYTITANVDGTSYVLRISVVSVAENTIEGSVRLQPLTDAQVTAPSSGVTFYYSSTQSSLTIKDSSGNVHTIDTTAV